jgi:hypothetical protein
MASAAFARVGFQEMMYRLFRASRLFPLLVAAFAALGAAPAAAAVEIAFYSRELGSRFPHNFITLSGTLDRSGERIDANYGFSATSVSPAILMGAVKGDVFSEKPDYIAKSNRHFRFTITDAEYDRVMATVTKWRTLRQPSYHLNKQNCVFFVADVAASLGMTAETPTRLMKKPTGYLEFLTNANRPWLGQRKAVLGSA